jgi:outer membrane usher protein
VTKLKSQMTLGDANTTGDVFDSVAFRGVQIATDDRMLPESLRGYASVVRGTAQSNARVTIRQNGQVIYETNVSPGPFEIKDLYATGYGGNLDVTVTEADGRTESFTVPYASVAQSLRPGTTRFSVTQGSYVTIPLKRSRPLRSSRCSAVSPTR